MFFFFFFKWLSDIYYEIYKLYVIDDIKLSKLNELLLMLNEILY